MNENKYDLLILNNLFIFNLAVKFICKIDKKNFIIK